MPVKCAGGMVIDGVRRQRRWSRRKRGEQLAVVGQLAKHCDRVRGVAAQLRCLCGVVYDHMYCMHLHIEILNIWCCFEIEP